LPGAGLVKYFAAWYNAPITIIFSFLRRYNFGEELGRMIREKKLLERWGLTMDP
jgi:hypothetical protein